MDLKQLEEIKRLAIIGMFSDDTLMDTLVLKGGNALDIVYQIANRSSIDLDFSIENDFEDTGLFFEKIKKTLKHSFYENGYCVFDLKIIPRPKEPSPDTPDFWGGYDVNFKIIETAEYERKKESINDLRKHSITVGAKNKKPFSIQISKHEYCNHKKAFYLDGYTIFAYSPEMIVFEKLRSICQQMEEYKYRKKPTARARDFFDIFTVLNNFSKINVISSENLELLKKVFSAKQVPLELLKHVKDYKNFHEPDFSSVRDTVKAGVPLKEYEYYFEYTEKLCIDLCKTLGIV